ncbi:ATP-binding protein [uncultured Rhodospira sp.]|uniref:sensor histidine kinase n=1 Tax=uncultured Rhodospira sp. TaxID=1936189 RepID=UPI00261FDF7D|nr:ATP-binding protein [uncultured Rhodospira sp.]
MPLLDPLAPHSLERLVETAPVAVLVQDLTDVWRRLEGLRAQGVANLGASLENNPDQLADLSGRVRCVMVNARARAIMGGGADGDPNRVSRRFLDRSANARAVRGLLDALWEGTPVFEAEGVVETEDGGAVSVQVHMAVPRSLEEAQAVALFLCDRAAASRQDVDYANRAKRSFLANMSHELRTPLNAINGFSEILLRELHGPLGAGPYREYVSGILQAGTHLLDLISDILDVSVVEAGELRLDEAPQALNALVATCLRDLLARAAEKEIAVRNQVPADLPPVRCDAARMRQVLGNLLSNAIKFTPRGGTVTVSASLSTDGGVVASVTDTGVGMSAADVQVALSPFGQVQNVFARAEGGTGLGLPLARALVEAHGGTLTIASHPQAGTTVAVSLPPWRVGAGAKV